MTSTIMSIGTDSGTPLSFKTAGTQRGFFDTLGNLAVSENLYAKAFIDTKNNNYFCNPSSYSILAGVRFGNNLWQYSNQDGYYRLYFEQNGPTYLQGGTTGQWYLRLGTGNDGVTRSIFVGGGDFYTNGNITAYWSDKRLKKNIKKIDDWRDIINNINGYRFEWNDLGKKMLSSPDGSDSVEVGLIAQEIKDVLPQAAAIQMMQYADEKDGVLIPKEDINYNPDDPYLTVRTEKLIPVLVEAIKGLMQEVDDLKKQINKPKATRKK